ncbi:hypothetical protein GCM10010219_64340 [Streptomyces netropsis]|nr:hypothetical protein GCM10010219_64340 [Streptomyces netropsis]
MAFCSTVVRRLSGFRLDSEHVSELLQGRREPQRVGGRTSRGIVDATWRFRGVAIASRVVTGVSRSAVTTATAPAGRRV